MSTIYEPFSSLVNTIWWLSDEQHDSLVNAWKGRIAHESSLCWYHPILPCFRTCFTLVVLHSKEINVIGDPTVNVLYSSIFASSSPRQLLAQVYAFKRSMVPFQNNRTRLEAYSVRSSTEFVPLSAEQSWQPSSGSEGWPVCATVNNGRVIYFVSLLDLPLMEHEFAVRRQSIKEGTGADCMILHRCIHVKVLTADEAVPSLSAPMVYFRPLVQHSLLMRSWDDKSLHPDNLQGSIAWHQFEQQQVTSLLAPMAEINDLIADLGDVFTDPELELPVVAEEERPVVVAASATPREDEEEEQEHLVVGFLHAPIVEDEEEEEEVQPLRALATLTAYSLSKEERKNLAKIKYQELVVGGVFVHEELITSFQTRANLESLLRAFFDQQSKFEQNVDSLDAFFNVDLLIHLVQLTPFVSTEYFGAEDNFYEKWNFALFLASRSFLHALGCKEPKYLNCDRSSRVAKELKLNERTTLHDSDTWYCSLCNGSHEDLPTVQAVFKRQLQHSHWLADQMPDYPCSRCAICMRSLSDYLVDYVEKVQDEIITETDVAAAISAAISSLEEEDEGEEPPGPAPVSIAREQVEERFRLRTYPYYNTFAFAQLSCKCMKRDYCLSCLAEVHAAANLKNDRVSRYDEEDSWCLCLESTPHDMKHFNVVTRGQHATLDALTSMQLRLCYIWYRQLSAAVRRSSGVVCRNVMIMFYSPVMDDETQLTECFDGNGEVFDVNRKLCVQLDPVSEHEVHEVEFCMCLQHETLVRAMEANAYDLVHGQQGKRLRVICCRLDAYVESALRCVWDSLERLPLLAIVCTDSVLQSASRELLSMYVKLETQRKVVLFSRCTATGKLVSL